MEEHRDVAASYNNLESGYKAFGQYNKAKEYYEKESVIIVERIFGGEHVDVAENYNYKNLGSVYQGTVLLGQRVPRKGNGDQEK